MKYSMEHQERTYFNFIFIRKFIKLKHNYLEYALYCNYVIDENIYLMYPWSNTEKYRLQVFLCHYTLIN